MFYSTGVRRTYIRKEPTVTFALALVLVLAVSTAYLFHEWYSGDMEDSGP
jgi:hypothetical protein